MEFEFDRNKIFVFFKFLSGDKFQEGEVKYTNPNIPFRIFFFTLHNFSKKPIN